MRLQTAVLQLSGEGSKLLCIGDANGTIVASASGGSQTVGLLSIVWIALRGKRVIYLLG